MLQLSVIRENPEKIIEGLNKRNLKDARELVTKALDLDKDRRRIQVSRDEASSEINTLSAKIGTLIKEGKREEAEQVKQQVSGKKETIKKLEEELKAEEAALQEVLYRIPNVPADKVPQGKGAEIISPFTNTERNPGFTPAHCPTGN